MIKPLLISLALTAVPTAFAQQAITPGGEAPAGGEKAPAFKAHVLSRTEFDALLARPEKLVLIDVRRPDELTTKGGFPVYLSIQLKDLDSNLAWIPKNRTIVTVSNHAARAGKAADLLAAKGFKVAGAIGVEGYEKDGGTLTRIAAPAATGALVQTQH